MQYIPRYDIAKILLKVALSTNYIIFHHIHIVFMQNNLILQSDLLCYITIIILPLNFL